MIASEIFDLKKLEKKQRSTVLDVAQVELWFQPSYALHPPATLHQEVLLRWRDSQQQLQLPQDFLAQVDEAGMTRQLDRFVLSQTVEILKRHPDLSLSVNLFKDAIYDTRLTQDLQETLHQVGVNPQRLSVELTEGAIVQDFGAALTLIQQFKAIGVGVVLDDFVGSHLSIHECKQLPVNWVKVNGQLIQDFTHHFAAQALIQAILAASHELGHAIAKSVTDQATLQSVQTIGFAYAQGNYFHEPSPTPILLPPTSPILLPEATPTAIDTPPTRSWRRIGIALTLLGLGAAACTAAAAVANYRLNHIVAEGGQINGRVTQIQAPISGKLREFYAQPGAVVRSGQVLARIRRSPQEEQSLLTLEGEIRANEAQLLAARNSLATFQAQLAGLGAQDQSVRTVDVSLAEKEVSQKQAAIASLSHRARAAQLEYQRYRALAAEGAITRQKADELELVWRSLQADVDQAKAASASAQASLQASQEGIASSKTAAATSLADQRAKLSQTIQEQSIAVNTLQAKLVGNQQKLKQARSLYNSQQDAEVKAPLQGVIYTTQHDRGGQVNLSEPMITLLDCNNLWAEAVLPASQAGNLDTQQSVQVQLVGKSEKLTGRVAMIQPIGSSGAQPMLRSQPGQTEALPPAIPLNVAGQPLVRVMVEIPPPPEYGQAQRFCGWGSRCG
ncbi:MAG: EAL domain-containing protein [Leptolyngbyaceae cyanobacterium CSU_1_3]|nr:EAL domain-containing protein [Leptolyngbyaceae cyanobacterium CSU_1_3]